MSWRDVGTLDPSKRGVELVADIEEALQSIQAGNPGNTEPLATSPGQLWADTDEGYEKQRNQADDAWIYLWPIDSAPLAVVARLITAAGTTALDPYRDSFVLVDATVGNITIKLPDSALAPNKRISLARLDGSANTVTIEGFDGTQPIPPYVVTDLQLRTIGETVVLWNSEVYGPGWFVEVDGTRPVANHTVTGNIDSWEELVLVDTSGGVVTLTLPLPSNYWRRELIVKRIAGGNNAVVQPDGSHQIDSLGNGVGVTLAAVNDRIRLRSDGAQWWRVD